MRHVVISVTAIVLHLSANGQNATQFKNRLGSAQNDSVKTEVYRDIYAQYQFSQPDSVYYFLQDGLKQFLEKNYRYGIATITNLLGSEDANHGNMGTAKKRQEDALKIFEEINNPRGIGRVENDLGVIEGRSGNFDVATKHFFTALKIHEGLADRDGLLTTYINLGTVNDASNNSDKALEYFTKALTFATDPNEVRNLCNLYNNIGIIYAKKGDLKTSLDYFQKALKGSNKEEYVDVYIYSLLNLGIVYQKYGDDEKSLQYLHEALQIAKNKKMPEEYARILLNISSVTCKKNPAGAIAELTEALDTAKKLGVKSMLDDIYFNLVANNKTLGNYKAVSTLQEEEMNIDDSLFNIAKVKEIANLETVYELEQRNNDIKQLKLTEQADLLKRNVLILIVGGLVALLIFISVYLRKTRLFNHALSRQKAELAASNNVKDQLFSTIGHDLRGPVANITMMLETLEDENTEAEERKYLFQALREQSMSTLETLDNLLYWGKSQIKVSGTQAETFNTTEYLQKNISLLHISAMQKKITVINKVPTDTVINGDTAHFDFIIRNLLSNAIKYTHENGIVEISAGKNIKPGFTVFAVKDNGVGIQKELLKNIFESLSSSTRGTGGEKGTGIGLMLCKKFAEENGGNIWVESEPGKGATFYFSFRNA